MSPALILVDLQYDFLPAGALAVPNGDAVVPVALRLLPRFDCIVATQDWHPADHLSFASQHVSHRPGDVVALAGQEQMLWPDHCVQGTRGAEIVAEVARAMEFAAAETHVVPKGQDREFDSYSGFFDNGRRHATGLAETLARQHVTTLFIMGLATDYCVKFTALDAVELGFETHVVVDGCRGVNLRSGDAEAAIAEMEMAGVRTLSSHDVP